MRIHLPTRAHGRAHGRALGRAVAAVAAVVTVLSVSAAPVSARTSDGPGYGQPSVGECRDLDLARAMGASETTAPIECANPHTTRVIAVGRLPAALGWDAPAGKLASASFKTCETAALEAIGGTVKQRNMSAYQWFWFIPTRAQRAHGARWFRCDLTLLGGARLLRLPTDSVPAVDSARLPDSVARCLTARILYTTTCARQHAFRATGAFRMPGTGYPTPRQFASAAAKRCPALASRRYAYSIRGRDAWRFGDRTVVCSTKTRA
jgi:hypothetical protein